MKILIKLFKQNIASIYYDLILWFQFIKSIKLNNRPILIFNYEKWHLGIDYNLRKQSYKNFLTKLGYNIICIDLKSHSMVFLLNIILNGFSLSFNKKILINNLFSKKFLTSYKYANWDIFIRKKKLFNKESSVNRKEYRNIFNNFNHKPKNDNYWKTINQIFNNKKVKGLVLTQLAYEELPLARFGLDNELKLIFFESIFGILVINPSNSSIMDLIIKSFENSIKKISLSELQKHRSIIDKRVVGIEKDTDRYYLLSTHSKNTKDYRFFNIKAERTLCLYLHCFTDAPNEKRDTENYSPFVDYFELALYIIDYCANNKIPILIKPHPASSSFPSDKYYLESLIHATLNYEKTHNLSVEWVGNDFKNIYLKKLQNPILVTARGTVVSESAYLGIPSISFSKSSWYSFKNLTYFVETEADFEKIFPVIDKLYKPDLSKKEGILLSAALEIGYKNTAYKIGTKSSTVSNRHNLERAWKLREEI